MESGERFVKNKNVSMRELQSSNIDDVVAFHNLHYGTTRTPESWIWKYHGYNPDAATFVIAKDGGKIVGTQGMIPVPILVNGKYYLSGKSEDSLLDSEYRGKQIFSGLYKFAMGLCASRKMHCVWGFTPAVKVWRDSLNFRVYEDIVQTSVLVLRPESILHIPLGLYAIMRKLINSLFVNTQKNVLVEQKLRSPEDLKGLYERLVTKHKELICLKLDKEYLTWRIFDNPNIKYDAYFVYENNELRAYCYFSMNKNQWIRLSDFTCEDYTFGKILLKKIIDDKKPAYVLFMGNKTNVLTTRVFELLRRFGSIKKRSSSAFVLQNISFPCEDSLYEVKNWYLNGLWTEGFQW